MKIIKVLLALLVCVCGISCTSYTKLSRYYVLTSEPGWYLKYDSSNSHFVNNVHTQCNIKPDIVAFEKKEMHNTIKLKCTLKRVLYPFKIKDGELIEYIQYLDINPDHYIYECERGTRQGKEVFKIKKQIEHANDTFYVRLKKKDEDGFIVVYDDRMNEGWLYEKSYILENLKDYRGLEELKLDKW